MRIIIEETAAALEHAHSLCQERQHDDDTDDVAQKQNPYDLVLWTDASANARDQAGPSAGAVVYRSCDQHDRASAWNEVAFGMLGQKKTHQVELFAILYALRVALRVCKERWEGAGARARAEVTSIHDEELQGVQVDGDAPAGPSAMGTIQILSDCQGALVAIRQGRSQNLTRLVELSIAEIERCGMGVDLRWVPAHRVVGNKLADRLAMRTCRRLRQTPMNFGKKGLRRMGLRKKDPINTSRCAGTFLIWPSNSNSGMDLGITLDCVELAATVSTASSKICHHIVLKLVDCL